MSVTNRWNVLFAAAASLYTVGNIFYVLLITGDVQIWNNPAREPEKRQEETGGEMEELNRKSNID